MKEGILFDWASQGPPPPQVASMLKEKAAFLQKHNQVQFGKDFRDHLTESLLQKLVNLPTKREGISFCQGSQRDGGMGGEGAKMQVELKR